MKTRTFYPDESSQLADGPKKVNPPVENIRTAWAKKLHEPPTRQEFLQEMLLKQENAEDVIPSEVFNGMRVVFTDVQLCMYVQVFIPEEGFYLNAPINTLKQAIKKGFTIHG